MKKHLNPLLIAILVIASAVFIRVPPPSPAFAQFTDQSTFGGTSGGSANAQTLTISNYTANKAGIVIRFVPGFTNTGPATININGLGAANIVRPTSIGNVLLSGGELLVGEATSIMWNALTGYQLMSNVDMTPIGSTVEFRGSSTPRGTLVEDGTCVSQTTYSALYTVIGTGYGACGAGLFALPDSRGTMTAALDTQGSNGAANRITSGGSGCAATSTGSGVCGSQNQTVSRANLPNTSVTVSITDPGHTHPFSGPVNTAQGGGSGTVFSLAQTSTNTSSASTGISAAFNLNGGVTQTTLTTLPPTSLVRRAIKY